MEKVKVGGDILANQQDGLVVIQEQWLHDTYSSLHSAFGGGSGVAPVNLPAYHDDQNPAVT